MMDVSGSMTDEQKEIVRIEAFWIDTWIKAPLQGRRDGLHHPRRRRPGGGRAHLLPHPRERRHEDQLGLRPGEQDHRRRAIRRTEWNIYAFHFSDGDNWGDDIPHCIEILTEKLLPKLNLFGYGQVESPYGSGEFFEYVHELLGEHENVVVQPHPGPRRDPRIDQGVPGDRAMNAERLSRDGLASAD